MLLTSLTRRLHAGTKATEVMTCRFGRLCQEPEEEQSGRLAADGEAANGDRREEYCSRQAGWDSATHGRVGVSDAPHERHDRAPEAVMLEANKLEGLTTSDVARVHACEKCHSCLMYGIVYTELR